MSDNGAGKRLTSDTALAFWDERADQPDMPAGWDPIYGRPGPLADLLRKWKAEADAKIAEAERELARINAEAERLKAAQLLDERVRAWRQQGSGLQ